MKTLLALLMSLLAVLACGQHQPQPDAAVEEERIRQEMIDSLEFQRKMIRSAINSGSEAYDSIRQFIKATEDFARTFPGDTANPSFLLEAADLAGGVGIPGSSIELWGLLWRQHPDHPEAPYAMFMQAFVFETAIGDRLNASRYYRMVTDRYPNHQLASSAELALKVLNESQEDLIRQFENR